MRATQFARMAVGDHPATWRAFSSPVEVLHAEEVSDVRDVVRRAERHALDGRWVVGMVGYEAAAAFDPAMPAGGGAGFPLAWFAAYDGYDDREPVGDEFRTGVWSRPDEAGYVAAIDDIHRRIAEGETYQVNYAVRLRADFVGDPLGCFAALSAAQPTDQSVYIDIGRYVVCSVSPELFIRRTGDLLVTAPMKGTVRRGESPEEDAALIAALRRSAKNSAENVMIVDLLRSDLGRIARPGTVQVRDLLAVQTLPTLHTMTSTIDARVASGTGLVEVFEALFPCGSVTGAPKISTMRIIDELEPEPRGAYCGTLGLIAPGGDATFNVAIRTPVIDRVAGRIEYGVGGGITIGSTAAGEYAEVLTKARVLDDMARRGTPEDDE